MWCGVVWSALLLAMMIPTIKTTNIFMFERFLLKSGGVIPILLISAMALTVISR